MFSSTCCIKCKHLHGQRGSSLYFKFSALKLAEKHSCETLHLDNSAGNKH